MQAFGVYLLSGPQVKTMVMLYDWQALGIHWLSDPKVKTMASL